VLQGESDEFTALWKWIVPSQRDVDGFKIKNNAPLRALIKQTMATIAQDLK
jgi:hypothetical protein